MNKKTKKIALFGLLTALALVLGLMDRAIPLSALLGGAVPGIKLGLANTVLLYAVYLMDWPSCILLMLTKVVLSGLIFGSLSAIWFSLAGGALSLAVMLLVRRNPSLGALCMGILAVAAEAVDDAREVKPRAILDDMGIQPHQGQVAHLHPLAEQPQKRYRHVERVEAGKPSLAVILLHIQVVDSHMASEQVQPHMLHVRLPANQVVGVVVDIIFGGASAKEAARNHHQQHPR